VNRATADYSALASSSANALPGPPLPGLRTPPRLPRRGRKSAPCPAGATGAEPVAAGPAEAAGPPALRIGRPLFGLGGCAGLARSSRSSRGARSKRRMMEFISSVLGASMKAKPFDSCVSGLRMTLIASATRFSALSQPLISSAVTQAGRLPKKTVKLIRWLSSTPLAGGLLQGGP